MKKIAWKLKLENDIFARKHIKHVMLLVGIEILAHIVIAIFIWKPAFSFYPITQIITLLIYQNTHEETKKQLAKITVTSILGFIFASIITLWLRSYIFTLPLIFLCLLCVLYYLKQPFYIIPAGIIIIIAYFDSVPAWWYFVLLCDIIVCSMIAVFLSQLFHVTSFENFKENYVKLRYDFDHLATTILQFEKTDTTYYFQRILQLETIFKKIKQEKAIDYHQLLLLDQLLQEVNNTYFYLRALNGKSYRDEIYREHFMLMSQHYRNWIELEQKFGEEGIKL